MKSVAAIRSAPISLRKYKIISPALLNFTVCRSHSGPPIAGKRILSPTADWRPTSTKSTHYRPHPATPNAGEGTMGLVTTTAHIFQGKEGLSFVTQNARIFWTGVKTAVIKVPAQIISRERPFY